MERTEHIGLHQWAGTDQFLREEFNEDFRRIDGAIGEVAAKGYAVGSYNGNNLIGVTQRISLGFEPSAVIICQAGHGIKESGAVLVRGVEIAFNGQVQAKLTADGFEVRDVEYGDLVATPRLTYGENYCYIAFR